MKMRRLMWPFSTSINRVTSTAIGNLPSASTSHPEHAPRIDRHDASGDPPGAGGRQEYVSAREIVGLEHHVQGIVRAHPLFHTRIAEVRPIVLAKHRQTSEVGSGAAGGHAVHADPRSQLHRELSDQPD